MDLHPIIVHFPIALLTIYGLMELIRHKKLLESESWFYIKASFLIIGVIGAFFALSSGDVASEQLADRTLHSLVEVHEGAASTATTIFTILAALYVLTWIDNKYNKKISKMFDGEMKKTWKWVIKIKNIVYNTPLIWMVALAGLVAITITGALGGAIVYGPNADPIIALVYGFFF